MAAFFVSGVFLPLPQMVGSDESLMSAPGMQGAAQADPSQSSSQNVDPQEQIKGAVQIVASLQKDVKDKLSGIATQFPSVSEPAQAVMAAINKAIDGLVRELIKTVNVPEQQTPNIVR